MHRVAVCWEPALSGDSIDDFKGCDSDRQQCRAVWQRWARRYLRSTDGTKQHEQGGDWGAFGGQDASTDEDIKPPRRQSLANDSSLASSAGTVNVNSENRVAVTSFAKTQFHGVGSLNSAFANTAISGVDDANLAKTILGVGSAIVVAK